MGILAPENKSPTDGPEDAGWQLATLEFVSAPVLSCPTPFLSHAEAGGRDWFEQCHWSKYCCKYCPPHSPQGRMRTGQAGRKSPFFLRVYARFLVPSMVQCDGEASKPPKNLRQGTTPVANEDASSPGLVQRPLKFPSGSNRN